MLGDYYHHRWAKWFDFIEKTLISNTTYNEAPYGDALRDWQDHWLLSDTRYRTEVAGNAVEISKALWSNYSHLLRGRKSNNLKSDDGDVSTNTNKLSRKMKLLRTAAHGGPPLLPETDWFAEAGHGVFTHLLGKLQNEYGPNSQNKNSSWDAFINQFDAEAYADSAARTGAKYVVLTMTQQEQFLIAPNSLYDRYTGFSAGEAASTRDLVLDVHAALAR